MKEFLFYIFSTFQSNKLPETVK